THRRSKRPNPLKPPKFRPFVNTPLTNREVGERPLLGLRILHAILFDVDFAPCRADEFALDLIGDAFRVLASGEPPMIANGWLLKWSAKSRQRHNRLCRSVN